ncbi:SDR family NAD(P)-dependent oxidoreductase [Streptomyces sp. NPDC047085]|uniref:SDR family NAD(P)-dependent oxidoreductase n=1 Tax=Streptomyces sp. NPDC047085 TaxID=3155140 RepID=UPI0033D896D0
MTTSPETIGPDFLTSFADAARGVPGVLEAAAVARMGVRAADTAPPSAAQAAGAQAVTAQQAGAQQTGAQPTAGSPQGAGAPAPLAGTELPPSDLYGGDLVLPDGAPATLQEGLRRAAELAPDKGTVYIRQGREDVLQTYAELLDEAQHVLGGFRAAGLKPGDAALFVFDDNRGYLTAFWACVLGGFVPTPVAVATSYTTENETNRKLHGAWKLLGRPVLVTDAGTVDALAGVHALWGEPDVRILTVEELAEHPADEDWFEAGWDSPVLNLLTSGSTGVPKCVQHTNSSVVSRSFAVAEHCGLTEDDVSLIWMPFDHVTVAFYNVRDVFLRCLHVNAKIDHFLADPLLWFDWADRYRATNTWAPNFAMAMVNERAADIRERSWDLSCLREITNGGEPVIASTSHRFLELLAPHGLPADAMVPAWGMSETCSGVTYTRQSREDLTAGTVSIDPASLGETIRYVDPDDLEAVVLSRVGRPIPGVRIRIVDDGGAVLPEGRMGELRITGPTITAGYFGNEEANREAFDEQGWFRTGDLAFVRDGEAVIAGRQKDQIIVRGINYMAHELESVVERVDGVRVTFSAAAGVREPGASTDQLVVFFVPVSWDADALATTKEQARAILVRESGIAPDLLIPVTEGEFHKTASGKIQRAALVADFKAGRFADRVGGPAAAEEEGPDTWFSGRQWVRLADGTGRADGTDATPRTGTGRTDGTGQGLVVVLAEDADLDRLGLDGPFVAVGRGDALAQELPYRYRVPAADRTELRRLLTAVTERYGPIGTVVHALPLSLDGEPAERLATATAELTALLGALADGAAGHPRLLVLTSGAFHVHDGDRVDLGVCALPGFVRTAISEAAPMPVKLLDLHAGDPAGWAGALRAELAAPDRTGLVAARGGARWQPRLTPVETDGATSAAPVTAGGLYLVTGGLGGIAHDIAAYLLAAFGVKLLLVGRSAADGERGERLAALSRLGQVAYEQLDVADAGALDAAIAAAEQRFGRTLDGVLHLAAADPTGQWADLDRHLIVNESAETYAGQYRAKVHGTLALARALEHRPNASLVLFGSVNGEFGGHSFGAYATASSFLIGFADHWHHERGRRVHCLAWSQWSGVGMNRGQSSAAAENRGFRTIDPDTGLRLFLEATALPGPYTIVGLDLRNPAMVAELVPQQLRISEIVLAYVAEGDGADVGALRTALAASVAVSPVPVRLAEVARIPRDAYGEVDTAQLLADAAPERARRQSTPPHEGLESELADLWSDALARTGIGRDESFFELGGNSLRATRLLALTEQKLGVRVTTQELYENPTVAGMAAVIEQRTAG